MHPGAMIRKARKKKKLTLKELAALSGVSYSRISRIENGDNAGDDAWKNLADALGLKYTPARLEEK